MLLTFRAEKYMCDVLHVYMCEVTQVNGVTVTSTMFVCLDTACMLNSMWTVEWAKLATFTVSQYFKGCLYHHTDVKLKTCDDSDACENDLIDIGHTTFLHCWTNASFILWESGVSAKGVSVPSKDAEQPELSPDLLTA